VATILVVGSDTALLEGVMQTLVGAGQVVKMARDINEALEMLNGFRPLVALAHSEELIERGVGIQAMLAQGGALMAYRSDDDDEHGLPFSVKRATLAELHLPLERQRLLALVRFVESRAKAAGRHNDETDDAEVRSS
jgi:CheY-like chemotaxis protein